MDATPLALLALVLGAVIGAGVTAMIVAAVRARRTAQAQTSTVLPDGLTAVLASMDDAACAVDASGVVVVASPPSARLGIQAGTTLENTELRRLVRSVRDGGTATETIRITRERISQDSRLVSARASAMGPRLSLLVIRDVTEQERLDQMRTDFVANTSHELKTPVGAVTLLAEAIESAADDPEQVRAFASRISDEAARLGQLTGRIMSLSRLQSADGLGEFGPVAIDEVIASAVDAHTVQADSAAVELSRGGERGTWVHGDAQVLIEAVGNLLANAILYSPRGSRVGIGVKVDDDVVEIAVTDQGIGISDADRARIFERFYRADDARSRRTGGTGLGLSIVKHATQRHGGEVRVWSRPGRGSTFTMRLPRIDAPQQSPLSKRARKKTDKVQSKTAKKRRKETA
ncbi:ATP-binding protein [Microbacterium pseudoresistens]|uniref:Sensor-like histidine kinase SenX3 n=1 Tax=Microbacterium pseudoresistens TaxID=640634 RepID=A0A7Y9JPM2_9MICO|nr:ATP-binding protein [Microbacterium pseudoresistens]NYD54789.1 two-component system sensor histidine kinase SenX3 [Microbacterium pseudoresistens]